MTCGAVDFIYNGLDLGFSDCSPGDNVRDNTIREHGPGLLRAVAVLHADEAVSYSIFSRYGDHHSAAEIYALDFPSDLRAALYVLLGGYYKQALTCLRSWFEMRLLRVYFGAVEQDQSRYADWKAGNREVPFGRSLIRRLFGEVEYRREDARVSLRRRLESLYSDLCQFTHGAGMGKHALQADTDNVPRYNRSSVELFLNILDRAFSDVLYVTWVAFGANAFACVDKDNETAILDRLAVEYRSRLEASLPSSTGAQS